MSHNLLPIIKCLKGFNVQQSNEAYSVLHTEVLNTLFWYIRRLCNAAVSFFLSAKTLIPASSQTHRITCTLAFSNTYGLTQNTVSFFQFPSCFIILVQWLEVNCQSEIRVI